MRMSRTDSYATARRRSGPALARLRSDRRGQTLGEYALILALLGSGVLYAGTKLLTSIHAQLTGGVVVETSHPESGAEILKKK